MDEVQLIVDKGYMILEIYEVYEYQMIRYVPESREGGLFAHHIETLVNLIAVAGG